ncbi:MAG: DUF2089 domain-containing protein [Tannerella sp.]|nr:DUF2089 domain-containing protein [Tannerella sp.]
MEEIKKQLPLKCPACNTSLNVERLYCEQCRTNISGSFALPLLAKLTDDEQSFILDFVRFSGRLKDMAKKMGISYPTVRNILDDLINKLNKEEL